MKPKNRYVPNQRELLLAQKRAEVNLEADYADYLVRAKAEGIKDLPTKNQRMAIAPLLKEELNVATQSLKDVTMFKGIGEVYASSSNERSPEKVIKTYSDLVDKVSFFDTIVSKKNSTGLQLMYNNIDMDINFTKIRNVSSVQSLHKSAQAIQNVIEGKGGYFATLDIESIGGKNAFGVDSFLGATEYAFNLFGKEGQEAGSITNTIGLTDAAYQKVAARLQALKGVSNANWTGEDKVMIDRLNFYAHSTIENRNGRRIITQSTDLSDIKSTIAGAEAGLEKLGVMTAEQQKIAQYDLTQIINGMMSRTVDLNGQKLKVNAVSGHNLKGFDIAKINIFAKTLGLSETIDEAQASVFDFMHYTQYLSEHKGSNPFGKDKIGPKNKGMMTLEYLKDVLLGQSDSSLAAHTAFEDANTSAKILTAKRGNTTVLKEAINNLKRWSPKQESKFTGYNNQLFMLNQAPQDTGALSFTYDAFSNTYITNNGYNIKNGVVEKAHMSQAPLKKGAAYSFDLMEYETTEEFFKAFGPDAKDMLGDYGSGKLYVLQSTPVFDVSTPHAIGARQIGYTISPQRSVIEGIMNNAIEIGQRVNYGDDVDLSDAANYSHINGLASNPNLQIQTVENGIRKQSGQRTNKAVFEDLISMSTDRLTNESAANFIRELNYDKYKKITTVLQDITNAAGPQLSANASVTEKIAFAIANNQVVGGLDNLGGAFEALQFYSKPMKKKTLLPNSVNRYAWASENLESLMPLMEQIGTRIDELIPGAEPAQNVKRNEAFQAALRDILDSTSSDAIINTAEGIKKSTAFSSVPTKLLPSDLDYIELTDEQFFGKTVNSVPNKIRLNKERMGNGILSQLFKEEYRGRKGVSETGVEGHKILLQFIDRMNKDITYKGVFNGINRKLPANQLNAEIENRLKSFVENKRIDNNLFGIMDQDIRTHKANIKNVNAASLLGDKINSIVTNAVENTKNTVAFSRSTDISESVINQIANRMIGVTEDQINNLSLDSSSKRTMLANYRLAKTDIRNMAEDMLNALKMSNLELSFNEKDNGLGEVFITEGGQRKRALNLGKLQLKNNTLQFDLGSTTHVLRSGLSHAGLAEGKMEMISSIGEVLENSGSFSAYVKSAMNNGGNPLSAFESALGQINTGIRETMPSIQIAGPQAFAMQHKAHFESITGYLDKFSATGTAEGLPGYADLTPSKKKYIDSIFKKIKDVVEPGPKGNKKGLTRRDLKWSKLGSTESSVFLVDTLPKLLKANYKDNGSDSAHIVRNIIIRNKSTDIHNSGTLAVGAPFADFMTSFDSQPRDNPNQWGNLQSFKKELLTEQSLSERGLKNSYISGTPILTDVRKNTVIFGGKNAIGTEMTGMLTTKFVSIDSQKLNKIIIKAGKVEGENNPFVRQAMIILGEKNYKNLDEKAKKDVDDLSAQLKERALHASTYEQESLVHSRLTENVFGNINRQFVPNTKSIKARNAKEETRLAMLQFDMNKGQFKYGKGFVVGKNDSLFVQAGYANSSNIIGAKHSGLAKGGFFDEYDNLIDESEISKLIGGKNLTHAEIEGQLKAKYGFNFKYYVDEFLQKEGTKLTISKTEKSVTYGLTSRLGEFNPKIVELLKGTPYEKFLGKQVTNTLIDQLPPKVRKLALQEKHAIGDIIFGDIFAETGATILTAQNVPKHGGVSVVLTSAFGKMKELGKLNQENVEAVFKGARLENGSVVIPERTSFNSHYINFDNLEKIIGESAFSSLKVMDQDVQIGYAEVAKSLDWMGGSSIGIDDFEAKESQIKEFEQTIDNLYAKKQAMADLGKDTSAIDREIQSVKQSLQSFRDKVGIEAKNGKGFTYSDRMHGILSSKILNDEYVGTLLNKQDDVVNSVLAPYLEDGKLKAEYRGQSVLSPLVDNYKNKVFSSPGSIKLANVSDTDERYGAVKSFFTNADGNISLGNDVSADWAEKAYTFGSTKEALAFNTRVIEGKSVITTPGKFGFSIKNLQDADLSFENHIESQKAVKESSPYFNNFTYDLGEEFGARRYISVAKPATVSNGDAFTVPNHFASMATLQKQHATWKEDMTTENYDKVVNTANRIIQEQAVDLDMNNREMIKTRLDRSITPKAAGKAIYRGGIDEETYQKLGVNEKFKLLTQHNDFDALKNAKFLEKTYLEHYAENRMIDTVLLSEGAIEDLGFLDEKYLAERKLDRQGMLDLLATKGDMFLAGRFPMIKEGSAGPVWGIYDKTLTGNVVRTIGSTQKGQNLDFDGDATALSVITDKDGKTYLDSLLSGTSSDFYDRNVLNMIARSTTTNRAYEAEVQDQLQKELEISLNAGNIRMVAKKAIGDSHGAYAAVARLNDDEVMGAYNFVSDLKAKNNFEDDEALLNHLTDAMGMEKGRSQYFMYQATQNIIVESAAKAQKRIIGESNVINFKARKVFDTFVDKTLTDYNERRSIFGDVLDIAEQTVISAKTVQDVDLERSDRWKNAFKNVVSGRDVQQNKSIMAEIYDQAIADDMQKKLMSYKESYSSFADNMTKEEFSAYAKQNFLDSLDILKSNDQIQKAMKTTLHFGEDKHGIGSDVLDHLLSFSTDNSIQGEAIDRLIDADLIESGGKIATRVLGGANREDIFTNDGLGYLANKGTSAELRNMAKTAISAFEDVVKKTDGKTLALGSLGLAGAYMMAGIIGGNPSAPADTQAAQVQANQGQYYSEPQLTEQAPMQQKRPGYLINIAAKTNQDTRHASTAINAAVNQSMTTNVNVSMNIADDKGNINDRYVEQLMAGAIG